VVGKDGKTLIFSIFYHSGDSKLLKDTFKERYFEVANFIIARCLICKELECFSSVLLA